jgi:hypothetical protein
MTGGKTPLHRSALVGWRGKVSEALAEPLSRRTPLSADQVQIVLALAFFASSLFYVVATIRRAVRDRSTFGDA